LLLWCFILKNKTPQKQSNTKAIKQNERLKL
jgi:hypothetical protein